jgi:hypothetical protein
MTVSGIWLNEQDATFKIKIPLSVVFKLPTDHIRQWAKDLHLWHESYNHRITIQSE